MYCFTVIYFVLDKHAFLYTHNTDAVPVPFFCFGCSGK